jgi:hypothetical protein
LFFEEGLSKFGSVAKSNRPPSINFSFTKMLCSGLTLAPAAGLGFWFKFLPFGLARIKWAGSGFPPA